MSDTKHELMTHVFTISSIDCSKCDAFVEADDEDRCAESAEREGWIVGDGGPLCPACSETSTPQHQERGGSK